MKLLYFLLILIYILFSPIHIHAEWEKYPNNPVIKPDNISNCDSLHAGTPTVIYENNLYKMWYQGHNSSFWSICYATSPDGIIWTKNQNSLITPASYQETGITEVNEPHVINSEGIYKMWFKDRLNNKNRIRYATSSDGLQWLINPSPVLTGSANSWDYDGPTNPFVLIENNIYHLWYLANNGIGGPWQVGYAISNDGIQWEKSSQNPISIPYPENGFPGGVRIYPQNTGYEIIYHVGLNGTNHAIYHAFSETLEAQSWNCNETCEILTRTPSTFDQAGIVNPSYLKNQNIIWYGGYDGSIWSIGIAGNPIPIATPTNSPTLTPVPTINIPTPTIFPTPLPNSTSPIIIIPGFFASWNRDAIVFNQSVSYDQWNLNPFVTEYDGLIKTFKNSGLKENQDFYIFPYDWRKKLDASASDLQQFIQSIVLKNKSQTKVHIIGHSLGGLVGRVWAQSNGLTQLNSLITIGTPHLGTAQVYKAVQAGELDKTNDLLWLAQKTIIQLNRKNIQSDKEVINSLIPVLKDLLPIYPYLSRDSVYIPVDSMSISNDQLIYYDLHKSIIFPFLYTISGNKGQTLFGYEINQKTNKNEYVDGIPKKGIKKPGDYVITQMSSEMGTKTKMFPYDHSEIIYKKESIKYILNVLNIPISDHLIVEGTQTKISPSIILLVTSPHKITLKNKDKIIKSQNGILFIPEAQSDKYQLEIEGKYNDQYDILVGQIGNMNDKWTHIKGNTLKNNNIYEFDFNSEKPESSFKISKPCTIWCEVIKHIIRK